MSRKERKHLKRLVQARGYTLELFPEYLLLECAAIFVVLWGTSALVDVLKKRTKEKQSKDEEQL